MPGDMARYFARLAWPGAQDGVLLRACLGISDELSTRWLHDPQAGLARLLVPGANLRWALPLLDAAFHDASAGLGEVGVKLRAAALHETRRSATFDAITATLLERLWEAECPPCLSRGQALALGGYPRSGLRHRHNLDILIAPARIAKAAETLAAASCTPVASHRFRHESGLMIVLHDRPLVRGNDAFGFEALSQEATTVRSGRIVYRRFAPHHLLMHVLLLTSQVARETPLVWAADAWFALQDPDIDWARIAAVTGPDAAPLLRALTWLSVALRASVPGTVLDSLSMTVSCLSRVEIDTALSRIAAMTGRQALLQEGSLRQRLAVLRWLYGSRRASVQAAPLP